MGPPAPPGGFADARHVGASGGFVGSRGSRSSGRYAASGWSDGSGFPAEHAPSGAPDFVRQGWSDSSVELVIDDSHYRGRGSLLGRGSGKPKKLSPKSSKDMTTTRV